MRGRNRKSHNPLTRVYESNGPDIKIRGTASHVAEKYVQLARDAQSSGDPVAAENYFQHAEHYFRLIAAAQDQFRQTQPFGYRPEGGGGGAADPRDDNFDDGEDEPNGQPIVGAGEQPSFGTRDPQPYLPRDAQFFSPREQQREHQQRDQQREHQQREHQQRDHQPRDHQRDGQREPQQQHGGRSQHSSPAPRADNDGNVDRLPSFITGGGQPQAQPQGPPNNNGPQGHQANGFDNQSGDRFPLHRRRRRHRGPRPDMQGGHQGGASEGDDEPSAP